jgi:hypothetical protein
VPNSQLPDADLVDVLKEVRSAATVGPVLVHVITEKGRGYVPAETASDKMHGVVKYDIVTGKQKKGAGGVESYTNVFADALIAEAEVDSRVLAVHAAMAGGTGLSRCCPGRRCCRVRSATAVHVELCWQSVALTAQCPFTRQVLVGTLG